MLLTIGPPPALPTGILVELPLAPFFLKKFRGAYCDINDLPTLDPELARCVEGVQGWVASRLVVGCAKREPVSCPGHTVLSASRPPAGDPFTNPAALHLCRPPTHQPHHPLAHPPPAATWPSSSATTATWRTWA